MNLPDYRKLQDSQWKTEKPMVWPVVLLIVCLMIFFAIGVGVWLHSGAKDTGLGKDTLISDAIGIIFWYIIFRIKRGAEKTKFYRKFR